MENVKIRPIGNSFGIILPKDVLDLLGLTGGDEIQIGIEENSIQIVLKKSDKKQ